MLFVSVQIRPLVQPEKQFRIGFTGASVWRNTTTDGKNFYSVTFSRMYRDGEDIKHTDSFSHDDLMNLVKLAERTEAYIASQMLD